MQAPYHRAYPQQSPQRPHPHAQPQATSRRGIGPMIHPGQPQPSMTAVMQSQQQHAAQIAQERARIRSAKPTDKTLPDGVEDCIIGDGAQRYKELREVERRLDAIMTRKRLDIGEAVNRNVKRHRTLRIWITNTVEEQPWQVDSADVDAFDFSTNLDSTFRVKIEGRLLDDDVQDSDSDSEDEEGDTEMDGAKSKKTKAPPKTYKLSHFFKAMTVDFERTRAKDGSLQSVEWKKPATSANSLPDAADFDQLEFKRAGDENGNITINLHRDENPERYQVSHALADILDVSASTRAEAVMGVWEYIKAMKLEEDEEKRQFECDDRLKKLFGRDKGSVPYLPDTINQNLQPLHPIKLPYTIRVDKEFHENPQPTIYDIDVTIDDPLKDALSNYISDPSYADCLREIAGLNEQLAVLVQAISNSKAKHAFLDELSKDPTEFIGKWLSSQKRDLEIVAGEATRGGGEDAKGDVWRKGGKEGIWGSVNARESVNLIVSRK